MSTIPSAEFSNPALRHPALHRSYFPAVNWGAILAGVVVGLSAHLLLTLLGIASGLSAMDLTEHNAGISRGPLWAGVWNGLTMLVGAFAGGYIAARMSGLKRTSDGVLHGFVAWGVTTLLFAGLATSAAGDLLGGMFSGVRDIARSSQASDAGSGSLLGARIESLIKGSGGAGGNIDASTMKTLQQRLQAGQRTEAIDLMTRSLGIEPGRAAAIVDQSLIVSGASESASSPQARASAQKAVDAATIATWSIFFAAAISLLTGLIGGAMGAKGSRRLLHSSLA